MSGGSGGPWVVPLNGQRENVLVSQVTFSFLCLGDVAQTKKE